MGATEMSAFSYSPMQTHDTLLSQELVQRFAGQPLLTYQTRTVTPQQLSEAADISPSGLGRSASLITAVVILTGGFTVGIPAASAGFASYSTLVSGRPAGIPAPIGEAIQMSPLHWASGL